MFFVCFPIQLSDLWLDYFIFKRNSIFLEKHFSEISKMWKNIFVTQNTDADTRHLREKNLELTVNINHELAGKKENIYKKPFLSVQRNLVKSSEGY